MLEDEERKEISEKKNKEEKKKEKKENEGGKEKEKKEKAKKSTKKEKHESVNAQNTETIEAKLETGPASKENDEKRQQLKAGEEERRREKKKNKKKDRILEAEVLKVEKTGKNQFGEKLEKEEIVENGLKQKKGSEEDEDECDAKRREKKTRKVGKKDLEEIVGKVTESLKSTKKSNAVRDEAKRKFQQCVDAAVGGKVNHYAEKEESSFDKFKNKLKEMEDKPKSTIPVGTENEVKSMNRDNKRSKRKAEEIENDECEHASLSVGFSLVSPLAKKLLFVSK
mmetsp:Transcript_12566/g.17172  ORF Transcript_12566/g.17172 Transcript_12566/m.17172 type:complete len:282 (+) Transcript_12566:662-1507(+)